MYVDQSRLNCSKSQSRGYSGLVGTGYGAAMLWSDNVPYSRGHQSCGWLRKIDCDDVAKNNGEVSWVQWTHGYRNDRMDF